MVIAEMLQTPERDDAEEHTDLIDDDADGRSLRVVCVGVCVTLCPMPEERCS